MAEESKKADYNYQKKLGRCRSKDIPDLSPSPQETQGAKSSGLGLGTVGAAPATPDLPPGVPTAGLTHQPQEPSAARRWYGQCTTCALSAVGIFKEKKQIHSLLVYVKYVTLSCQAWDVAVSKALWFRFLNSITRSETTGILGTTDAQQENCKAQEIKICVEPSE